MESNKRSRKLSEDEQNDKKKTSTSNTKLQNGHSEEKGGLEFEDPFGDEMEEEEINEESEPEEEMNDDDEGEESNTQVWRPGIDKIEKDEVLDYDPSAYDMYFAMNAEWPSLSIDIIRDNQGDCRTKFPLTCYVVAGTQASHANDNQVTIMKMSDLQRTKAFVDDDPSAMDEDDGVNDFDSDPVLESRSVSHQGGVNRIRSMPQSSNIVATWADTGKVHIWDLKNQLQSLEGTKVPSGLSSKMPPLYTFSGHPDEGFGMDWSPMEPGHFLTGDCKKYIYHWIPANGKWTVDKVPFTGHHSSVEDLQWSPSERTVFASCSTDCTIRIWDTRKKSTSMLDVRGHDDDINVISWNMNVNYLLASGSDDGSFKIWDLRYFKKSDPSAHFRYHTAPITSIEWHPRDESCVAVSGADNQISIWDLSVEEDSNNARSTNTSTDLPPQLLFVHQGQTDIKELHFHPQCPGVLVSTAADGFNIFKPANIS